MSSMTIYIYFACALGSPPNVKTPLVIADVARRIASDHQLSCTILGQVS